MKELEQVAQGVADLTKEIMYDSVEWQLSDYPQDGDDYNALHSYVMDKAIELLYKQNTNKHR
mgnify:FL=1